MFRPIKFKISQKFRDIRESNTVDHEIEGLVKKLIEDKTGVKTGNIQISFKKEVSALDIKTSNKALASEIFLLKSDIKEHLEGNSFEVKSIIIS